MWPATDPKKLDVRTFGQIVVKNNFFVKIIFCQNNFFQKKFFVKEILCQKIFCQK